MPITLLLAPPPPDFRPPDSPATKFVELELQQFVPDSSSNYV
jgi:hypothetical protein